MNLNEHMYNILCVVRGDVQQNILLFFPYVSYVSSISIACRACIIINICMCTREHKAHSTTVT